MEHGRLSLYPFQFGSRWQICRPGIGSSQPTRIDQNPDFGLAGAGKAGTSGAIELTVLQRCIPCA